MRTNDNLLLTVGLAAAAALILSFVALATDVAYERDTNQLMKRMAELEEVVTTHQAINAHLLSIIKNLVNITGELERRLHPAEETKGEN